MIALLRLAGRSLLLWFGAAFLCFGLWSVGIGIQEATQERRYEQQGRMIDAVVVSKSIRRASHDGNSSTKYEITYRFTADDGRAVEGADSVGVEEWESLEPGSAFKITYLPGAPESSRAEGSGGMESPLIALVLGSVLASVGGVLFVTSARRVMREWLLRRGGSGCGAPSR